MVGGPATFEGTTYQEGVVAYVFVHILAKRRLGWIEDADDTPLAVSGETGGPGDDVRVECQALAFEVQAKAGLTGEADLGETLRAVQARRGGSTEPIVLAVDRRSSTWLYIDFASDLERLRDGRSDFLAKARPLWEEIGDPLSLVRVKALDVLPPDEAQAERARDILEVILGTGTAAMAAWNVLLTLAADVTRRRRRRNRARLVDMLRKSGIDVPAIGADAKRLSELDFVRSLLDRRHGAAALAQLSTFEGGLPADGVSSDVRYWLWKHRATALNQLNRYDQALESARRALDIRPDGVEALCAAGVAAIRQGDPEVGEAFARRAIDLAPLEPKAWGVLRQIQAISGGVIEEPPPEVYESVHYRTVVSEIAVVNGDWAAALEATAAVLASGSRSPEVLSLRAIALMELGREPGTGRISPTRRSSGLPPRQSTASMMCTR